MNTEEFNEAKLLWKMFYAQECFKHAKSAAQHILENKLEIESPLFYPLMTSIYILYSKPFTKAYHGIDKLDDEMIPTEYMQLHQNLCNNRHQIYAHRDPKPLVTLQNIESPAEIRFLVSPDGSTRLFGTDFHARYPLMPDIINLCCILQEKTNYHVSRLIKKHLNKISKEIGEFRVNIYDEKLSFVEKVAPILSTNSDIAFN